MQFTEDQIAYAKERRQFGKAIAEFQRLQFMLADMAMQIEAARSLVYDCAGIADAGFESDAAFRAFSAKASMAKCFASDMAMKVTTDAVQIFGGAGYMKIFRSSASCGTPRSIRYSRVPIRFSV